MRHYTYFLHLTNGQYYIGVRSCRKLPQDDSKYLGSSKHIKREDVVSKTIICVFEDRASAVRHEIELHTRYDVGRNSKFANRAKQKSAGFDTTGLSTKGQNLGYKHTKEACERMSISHRDNTEYTFYHRDGRVFTGTRHQLCTLYGVRAASLGEVISGKYVRKSASGWSLTQQLRSAGQNRPQLVYALHKETNEYFQGNHYDFADKIGRRYAHVTEWLLGKRKSIAGWSLVR